MGRAFLKIRDLPAYRRDAFEAGLKAIGCVISPAVFTPNGPDDLLVVWNVMQYFQPTCEAWEAAGGTVVVAENGYLNPNPQEKNNALSIHWHNGAGWIPEGPRPCIFPRFPRSSNRTGPIVVLGQRGIGSLEMASPPCWAEKTAAEIKAARIIVARDGIVDMDLGNRLVVTRPHPGLLENADPLAEDLMGASLVVIWNSAAGVEALWHGYPVVYFAPHWIGAAGSGVVLTHERQEAAMVVIARGQWSVSEIASGEPFARMREQGWGHA